MMPKLIFSEPKDPNKKTPVLKFEPKPRKKRPAPDPEKKGEAEKDGSK